MAQPINCDICPEAVPAAFLMTRLDDGNTLGICLGCAPGFFTMLRDSLTEISPGDDGAQDAPQEAPDEESAPDDGSSGRAERWPHTEHVIPPGMRRKKGERATVEEVQGAELPPDVDMRGVEE